MPGGTPIRLLPGSNRKYGGKYLSWYYPYAHLFAIPKLSNVFKSQLTGTLSLVNFLNKIANIFQEQSPVLS